MACPKFATRLSIVACSHCGVTGADAPIVRKRMAVRDSFMKHV
jgi:hypothetical protein